MEVVLLISRIFLLQERESHLKPAGNVGFTHRGSLAETAQWSLYSLQLVPHAII